MSEASEPTSGRPFYVDAGPLASRHLTGIGRYTARLALALAKRGPVHFFDGDDRINPPAPLDWSEDQDLADWAAKVRRGRRALLTPESDSVGVYTCLRTRRRRFPVEASILHDLTPLLLPDTHIRRTIGDFQAFYANSLLSSDFALADSHSTRADTAWLSPFPEQSIHVAHPGASLCVQAHLHPDSIDRRPEVGLVVATLEPRKNAGFLLDWFAETSVLPPGAELWWVGATGWKTSKRQLKRGRTKNGRRVRFLGFVDDQTLCKLYKTAGWMAYPSLYEGFGFPVLDALRHGLPTLTAGNSSLREFEGPGVGFFDPLDPTTLDDAFLRLKAEGIGGPPSLQTLDQRFSWDRVCEILINAVLSKEVIPASQADLTDVRAA